MVFKCEFSNFSFVIGFTYKFKNPKYNSEVQAMYVGTSRIDGHHMFYMDDTIQIQGSLADHEYNGALLKNIYLVSAIDDHIASFRSYKSNREKLLEYFMNINNISYEDLSDEFKFKSLMRNLNINEFTKNY